MWSIPGYTEIYELGSGSQGRIVLARHDATGAAVAVKYLFEHLLRDRASREIFRREAYALHRVRSPFVAQIFRYVEDTAGAAIVMEAVPGRSLREVLDRSGSPLRVESALALLRGSLLGLAAAHATGVVHRDYKPGNVLVQNDGQSKLIDFGVAVLVGQGGASGTPAYMAPEQWMGGPSSAATDIYAATCVFVECVTGHKPYRAATLDELRSLHLSAPTPLELIPEELRPLVAWGLAKNSEQRLGNAVEFVNRLDDLAVRSYGPDWEKRGLVALGSSIVALGLAVPAVAIGGAVAGAGGSAAGTGAGAVAAGQAGAHSAGQGAAVGSKGAFAKIGGAKGFAAATCTTAAGVSAAVVLWPSSPSVGGTAHGSIHASFARPDLLFGQPYMPASETPYMDYQFLVQPATAKAGTKVRVTARFRARLTVGAKFGPGGERTCFGKNSERADVTGNYDISLGRVGRAARKSVMYLYATPPARATDFPDNPKLEIEYTEKMNDNNQPYILSDCAYNSHWTTVYTLTIPSKKNLPTGRYLLGLTNPMKMETVMRNGVRVPLASVGGSTQGRLPALRVIE